MPNERLVLPTRPQIDQPDYPVGFVFGEAVADDRYTVLGQIAHGHDSEVYSATDFETGDEVALKVFRETDEHIRGLVDMELRTHYLLPDHEGLVTTRDMGLVETYAGVRRYVATQFAMRGNLAKLIDEEQTDIDATLEMTASILPGLEVMHSNGLIHRDVKPENILLGDEPGEYYLSDFGIVAEVEGSGLRASVGLGRLAVAEASTVPIHGTPGFIAPESFHNEQLTPQVDVFAVGVTIFRAATGEMPFRSHSFAEYAVSVTNETPASMRSVDRSVPAELDDLTRHCLSPDPNSRPTVEELAKELQTI